MADLIHELGIDWKLLIASIVNFFILFFILRKYAYGPILGMLEKREKMIATSVDESKRIQEELAALETRKGDELKRARVEATALLDAATKQSETIRADALQSAKAEAEKLLEKTRATLAAERAALLDSVRADVADLVVAATEKVLAERLTDDSDRAFIERTLQSLEKERA